MLDVARRAGVTKQTVSNVVRGRQVVSAETRAKVEAAIAELGYTPNMVARGLATGTTMTVGFIVPTIAHAFYSEVVEEVEALLEESGYHLLLATTRGDGDRARRQLASLSSRSVDALLVAGDFELGEYVDALKKKGIPVALCAWEIDPPESLPVITTDFEEAGYLAGRHLRELGHEKVAVFADLPAHRIRLEGMRRAFAEDDLSVPSDRVFYVRGASPEVGYQAVEHALPLLRSSGLPTAVITSTDAIALGVMQALRDHGVRIPQDISVVGIDDIPQATHSHPPLTTVALPKRRMAREATALLLRAIAGEPQSADASILLSPDVVVRASSAPADAAFAPED
ncbi:LacI family DNA-binding transcriptional regulator [Streptomyces ipomoeae]|uniref:LacI family DNA-binding transcriptional regulator n=1 Tax=Streptomyces ipomoeae TaxID=103232 RepID=UPI001FD63060|nr:LacI family DNA-binding transcriptional regulator [Streptomyces ipomoeae]MDX2939474.1 LacI family DNA-binding transcriptional regulator [Streptomyces ipomoeae]